MDLKRWLVLNNVQIDSYLLLTLRTYAAKQRDRLPAMSELHEEVDKGFRTAELVIAFVQ